MLAWIDFVLIATLALLELVRYRDARSRSNVDLNELRDDVDAVLKRESTRLARERAALRRTVEGAGEVHPDIAPAVGNSKIGGVVRKEVAIPAHTRRA
jgi:hypothetical protein